MRAGRDCPFSVCSRGLLEISSLLCAESTTLLNVIDEYFSVNTSLVLVLKSGGQCSQNWPAFHFNSQLIS